MKSRDLENPAFIKNWRRHRQRIYDLALISTRESTTQIPASANQLMVKIFCNTREFYTKFQVVSTTIANGQRQWHGNLLDVCSHRIPLLARSVYPTVQHDRCGPTGRHPNPKKSGVALFYWITINADARPTEGGAVEEIEP